VLIAIYILVCLWALFGGLRWQAETKSILAETPATLFTDRDAWLADLEKAEAGEKVSTYSARPMRLAFLAEQHPGDLAALAFRHESIHPHTALIDGWKSEASLFRRYEVQGPSALSAGRLDMAFVVTVLLPLFLLILSFDVLSRERESGRFPLYLAQGGNAAPLAFARIVAVSIPLVVVPSICVLLAALMNGGSITGLMLWLATIVIYIAFWSGVAILIAVRFGKRASGAMAVLASWAIIVVLLPSGAQFVAQALYPLPSKVSYLTEARDAHAATLRNLDKRAELYMAEHPDLSEGADDEVPGFYRGAYLANVDINERTAPIIQSLESRQASQRRLVAMAGVFTPSLAAQRSIETASGTGPARSAEFRRQTRAFLRMLLVEIGPATVSKSRMPLDQARAIPEFAFNPPNVIAPAIVGLIWVVVLGVFLLLLGWRRAKLMT